MALPMKIMKRGVGTDNFVSTPSVICKALADHCKKAQQLRQINSVNKL